MIAAGRQDEEVSKSALTSGSSEIGTETRDVRFYNKKMMNARRDFQRLVKRLTELPTMQLIPLAFVSTYVASIPTIAFAVLHPGLPLGGPGWGKNDLIKVIVLGCVLAPLLETAVNQWACIRLLKNLRLPTGMAIVLSAAFFGLGHSYSILYMSMTFFVGLVLESVFAIEDARAGHPFLATFAVHALRNWATAGLTMFVL
ncbi:CPBP family intramembrane glutamic endopeptidase [Paraburkholderia caribensis]|uniref:CPBP family intramembrane glutamic endopeptidase n=1 Tax=Paraburkholderia caribensis TaxID=75105 RepID=UPI001CC4BCAB|nr:CPBP family intramembrane glutamic endopeptidase [Paraburkholderia caribensis]